MTKIILTETQFHDVIKKTALNILSELNWRTAQSAADKQRERILNGEFDNEFPNEEEYWDTIDGGFQQMPRHDSNREKAIERARRFQEYADNAFREEYFGNGKYGFAGSGCDNTANPYFGGFKEGDDIFYYEKNIDPYDNDEYRQHTRFDDQGNKYISGNRKINPNSGIGSQYVKAVDDYSHFKAGNDRYTSDKGWERKPKSEHSKTNRIYVGKKTQKQ